MADNRGMTGATPSAVLGVIAKDTRLRGYLRAGRIQVMPAKRARRLLLLSEVSQVFEPGVRYPETEVNRLLLELFDDCATLRRYLVDEQFLDRASGEYWRVGGPVAIQQ